MSNFVQFNPGAANQESDAAYAADSQRTGGFGSGQELPAVLLNKVFYQLSTFATAFTQMLLAKGTDTSDADVNALAAALATVQTLADARAPLTVVGYAASLAFDFSGTNGFQLTLSGNVTSSTFANLGLGRVITCVFIQDATGGRTFAWPTTGSFPVDSTKVSSPDPTPNSVSIQRLIVLSDGSLHPITPMIVS